MNKRVIIEIIIAIIVIIVVVLGYMFLNKNKSTTENNESIENLQSNKDESEIVNENAFTLNRNNMEEAPKEVEIWLKEINMIGSEY